MTDKQIIIDGCNVSGCENYRPKDRFTCYPYICNCHQKPDCYYKQLARKTQECEELKRKVELMMDCPDCKVDEYKKALEEIKEYTREQFCDNCEDIGSTEYTSHCEYCEYQEYFDIISKAKDGNE